MNPTDELQAELDKAGQMVLAANHPQAELHLRRYLRSDGKDPSAHRLLTVVARAYGVSETFRLKENRAATDGPRYLLIKAWGYGFWSDVHHVLGQLLVAELTQRTPIVRWGRNSLFGDGGDDAFRLYFEPVSALQLKDLPEDLSIYPPKWTHANLATDNVNKWEGPHSRHAAQFLFGRAEDLLVSDFYMTLASLIPWIGPESRYHGKSEDTLYAELFAKYIRPLPSMQARVDAFYQSRMAGRNWVAVHIRGSDKIHESAGLHQTNLRYLDFIDRVIELNPHIGVFLLTDSVDIHTQFSARYADRLVTTPALRSATATGVHMQGHSGRAVGDEVLLDALLAARCDYFVGNQESNVSMAISSLKRWPQGLLVLLGDKNCRSENLYLHRPATESTPEPTPEPTPQPQPCRLCQSPVRRVFEKVVLGRHRVSYHECTGCGALQTDTPHWLEEAYATKAEWYDTGKASRTLVNFLALQNLFEILGVRKPDLAVDFGGGTGLLARLLRDAGYNFHTSDKFGSSEFMGAYAWADIQPGCRLVTMFEVAEHFADPSGEWQRVFECNPDWVVGSTGLYTGQDAQWPYLSEASGQHVFFYARESIAWLAHRAGRHAYQVGMYFLITRHPLETGALDAITTWSNNLYAACQSSFESWARAPYRHASDDNTEVVVQPPAPGWQTHRHRRHLFPLRVGRGEGMEEPACTMVQVESGAQSGRDRPGTYSAALAEHPLCRRALVRLPPRRRRPRADAVHLRPGACGAVHFHLLHPSPDHAFGAAGARHDSRGARFRPDQPAMGRQAPCHRVRPGLPVNFPQHGARPGPNLSGHFGQVQSRGTLRLRLPARWSYAAARLQDQVRHPATVFHDFGRARWPEEWRIVLQGFCAAGRCTV